MWIDTQVAVAIIGAIMIVMIIRTPGVVRRRTHNYFPQEIWGQTHPTSTTPKETQS